MMCCELLTLVYKVLMVGGIKVSIFRLTSRFAFGCVCECARGCATVRVIACARVHVRVSVQADSRISVHVLGYAFEVGVYEGRGSS